MQLFSESQLDVVISVTVFIVAFIIVMCFVKFKVRFVKGRKIDNQYYVIESVLSKNLAKLDKIVNSISELRTRLDLLEDDEGIPISQTMVNTQMSQIKSLSSTKAGYKVSNNRNNNSAELYQNNAVRPIKSSPVISQELYTKSHKRVGIDGSRQEDNDLHKDTSIYILELLRESPRTAKEIQYDIGKTREHISRLVKKLYDEGLVSRDLNVKPFVYKITDEGHKLLG
jgi:DNA-binding transcriptional ArsR family regulator